MKLEERLERGGRAKEILDNPIFNEAFELLEKEITEQWQQSPARDSEGREKLFLMIGLTRKLKEIIVSTLETGKLADLELTRQRTLMERAKEIFE